MTEQMDILMYASQTPWPENASPTTWRIPRSVDPWELHNEMQSLAVPFELVDDNGAWVIHAPDGDPLANAILESAGCTPSDGFLGLLDGELQGYSMGAIQERTGIIAALWTSQKRTVYVILLAGLVITAALVFAMMSKTGG